MDALIIIARFLIVFVCAFIFGLERQKSHKPIGFGTFIFVSIGSCALAIISSTLSPDSPVALLGAIVTGIGFLGAGALIKTTDKIFGFTTAASIWIFAIFGLTIGAGEYLTGAITYISIWAIILFDKHLEKWGIGSYQRRITIRTNKIVPGKEIENQITMATKKYKVLTAEIDKQNNKIIMTYMIEGSKEEINKIPNRLYEKEWFDSCKVE